MANDTFQTPSQLTHPKFGFWGERDVTWLGLKTNLGGGWASPLTAAGYAKPTITVLETRGTVLGMFNDESIGGTGMEMYVAFGYAAGQFAKGGWAQAVKTDGADPASIVITGNDPILQEIVNEIALLIADSATFINAGIYISVADGFSAITPTTTTADTLGPATP